MAIVSIFLIMLIMIALIAGMAGCFFPLRNLEIRDWYDLDAIRDNLGGNHRLMNDLDSTAAGYEELASPTANEGKGWEPIEIYVFDSGIHGLVGTLDGQGHEIRDLFINRNDEGGVGLFGRVESGGVIKNIGLANVTVTGGSWVGGLVGDNTGTVSNSYFVGSVTGNGEVGGVAGMNWGTVSNSYSAGSVTGSRSVGGLVGGNGGTVSNSYYSYDEVLINGENIVTIGALFSEDFDQWLANGKFLDVNERLSKEGGYYVISNATDFKELLAFGQDDSLKFRLKADLELSAEPNFYIPYLAGEFDGSGHKISNLSFNFDFVSQVGLFGHLAPGGKVAQVGVENVNIAGSHFLGGLVGTNWMGTVDSCYATGSVTGDNEIGGLLGRSRKGAVSNSYSTSNVTGENVVGGLLGWNWGGTVSNSYSTGSVSGNKSVGGLAGRSGNITVTNSFWDTESCGQTTSPCGTGKTTAEMQDIITFSGAGWNIIGVANPDIRNPSYTWNIVHTVTYAFLSWQSVS
jgi:hypothetical protein